MFAISRLMESLEKPQMEKDLKEKQKENAAEVAFVLRPIKTLKPY